MFDIKRDLIQSLNELGINQNEIFVEQKGPNYYHPGISGFIITKNGAQTLATFGNIHPKTLKMQQ